MLSIMIILVRLRVLTSQNIKRGDLRVRKFIFFREANTLLPARTAIVEIE